MKNRMLLVLMMSFVLLWTACAGVEMDVVKPPEKTEDESTDMVTSEDATEETKDEGAIIEVPIDVDEEAIPEEIDTAVSTIIDGFVADDDLKGLWSYLLVTLPEVNGPTAEDALIGYMTLAESRIFSFEDVLFTDAGYEMQNSIYDIYEANASEFEFGHLMVGDDKYLLYDKMPEVHKPILKDVLDEGFGLINLEGSFYRIVDYKELHERYGYRLSDMTEAYLDIQASILVKQTTVEEYLLLTPVELMNRCVLLENYLIRYPGMPQLYNDMISRQLNLALYKLALPNPFDGSLDEDGTLSDEFEAVYNTVLAQTPSPVVTQVVQEFTAWVETREGGYIGTYMDTEELFEVSGEIFGRATEKITELYK